jgi:hypothetical protein
MFEMKSVIIMNRFLKIMDLVRLVVSTPQKKTKLLSKRERERESGLKPDT